MVQSLININGDVRDASPVTLPQDRRFRDAWQFNGDAITVDEVKKREIFVGLVNAERDRRMVEMAAGYTDSERETWPVQVEEAKAVLAGPNAPTPLLSALAAARGETVPDFAAHVLTLASQFAAGTGAIMARARALAAGDIVADVSDQDHWD